MKITTKELRDSAKILCDEVHRINLQEEIQIHRICQRASNQNWMRGDGMEVDHCWMTGTNWLSGDNLRFIGETMKRWAMEIEESGDVFRA